MNLSRKNTLLIIEDSEDLLYLTKELLESEGYEVYGASNGQEALNFLRSTKAKLDLILLDLMMPVMNGYQFREQQMLDPNLAAIPVIVVTADGNAKTKAAQLGIKDSYSKAGGVDNLLEIIRRIVTNQPTLS